MDALLGDAAIRHPNRWPLRLAVCGQYEARQWCEAMQATHVISIRKEGRAFHPPKVDAARHLVLSFEDTNDASHPDAPQLAHIEAAVAFTDALPSDARLLVHCLQGLSRSTALVLGILASEVSPLRAGFLLHRLRPVATPNTLLVKLWDARLGLNGELIRVGELFPARFWRHGDGLGNFPHRRARSKL